ncbi:MAG: hypothetical protein AAFU83_00025 [Bacteroidota bacterium]
MFVKRNPFHSKPLLYLATCGLTWAMSTHAALGLELSAWRQYATHVHLNISTGLGAATHDHHIVGLQLLQKDGKHYLYNHAEPHALYLIRWIDQSYARLRTYLTYPQLARYAASDPANAFQGLGVSFPLSASIHLEFLQKLRIEVGTHLLINHFHKLYYSDASQRVGDYTMRKGIHYIVQPWLGLGIKVFQNQVYTCLFDGHLALEFLYGRLKDPKSIYPLGVPLGLGLKLERYISEYCRLFVGLLYTTKRSYALFPGDGGAIVWEQQRVRVHGGISLRLPELPRCPIRNCKIRVKHSHGRKAYRGVNMFKNSSPQGARLP